MAAELEKRHAIKARLIKGGKGVFDVKADGELVFSKYQVRRFPKDGEVADLLESRL